MNRELQWQVLERYGVRGKQMKEAVKSLYLRSEVCVWIAIYVYRGRSRIQPGLERGETEVYNVTLAV